MRTVFFVSLTILITSTLSAQDRSAKRGICGDASPADLASFAPYISWYYNWSIEPPAVSKGELSGIEWVPMQWGAIGSDKTAAIASKIPAGSKFLLGFNEPNFKSQSNLTPAQAAAMWPNVEDIARQKNLALVSPAVNWCGGCVDGVTSDPVDWFDKFIAACPDCRFDYIAVHNYNSFLAPLKSYLKKFAKYGKPIWLTEFAPWDDPVDFIGVVNYMKEAVPFLENEPSVYRYSWFATRVKSNPDINLLGADGKLTKLGQLYAMLSFSGDSASVMSAPLALLPVEVTINLPAGGTTVAVKLAGTTYCRNNDAVSVEWSQMEGPVKATFTSTTVTDPTVSGLTVGTYRFQMTARANGMADSAQIAVTVQPVNIAKGKPVVASSSQNNNLPANVNDGNLNTRWSSLDADPQWISIDLGGIFNVTGAKIIWEAAYAREYTIDASQDGTTWTTVYTTKNGAGGTVVYTFTAPARYIRMNATLRNTREVYWGNSIFEFEVYGIAAMSVTGNKRTFTHRLSVQMTQNAEHLNMKLPEVSGVKRLVIVDCSGKIVFSESIEADQWYVAISVGCFSAGVYVVAVYDKRDRLFFSRLIITH